MENHLSSSGIFLQDVQQWKFSKSFKINWTLVTSPEELEDRIIFVSMFNEIDWIKKRNCKECRSDSGKVKNFTRRHPLGENDMERTFRNLKTVAYYCRCHGRQFQRRWTSSIPSFQCVGLGFLERERLTIFDSLQRWTFECRALISNKSFNTSAQHLRSCSELVSRIQSADTWSIAFEHGKIRGEGEWAVMPFRKLTLH